MLWVERRGDPSEGSQVTNSSGWRPQPCQQKQLRTTEEGYTAPGE
jgi:hypothetical protein